MRTTISALLLGLALSVGVAHANKDTETVNLFRNAVQTAGYFQMSYGYAVFPTIGRSGKGSDTIRGIGNVYAHGQRVGRVTVNQLTVGIQFSDQDYSQIVFFDSKGSLDEFTTRDVEFGPEISAIALTAADCAIPKAGASLLTPAAAEPGVANAPRFVRGMAVFTIAKGGTLYNAPIAGQKFGYYGGTAE